MAMPDTQSTTRPSLTLTVPPPATDPAVAERKHSHSATNHTVNLSAGTACYKLQPLPPSQLQPQTLVIMLLSLPLTGGATRRASRRLSCSSGRVHGVVAPALCRRRVVPPCTAPFHGLPRSRVVFAAAAASAPQPGERPQERSLVRLVCCFTSCVCSGARRWCHGTRDMDAPKQRLSFPTSLLTRRLRRVLPRHL
jgi:hypothetical protein